MYRMIEKNWKQGMLLLKLGSDFVYDNVNYTVGLMVTYLDSIKYYM